MAPEIGIGKKNPGHFFGNDPGNPEFSVTFGFRHFLVVLYTVASVVASTENSRISHHPADDCKSHEVLLRLLVVGFLFQQ